MTEQDYVLVYVRTDRRFCAAGEIWDLEGVADLASGVPVGRRFPRLLDVDLSPSGGDMVTDFVNNNDGVLIVSQKAQRTMEQEGIVEGGVEYLPIRLRDKKKKAIAQPYFIVNVLTTVKCLDWERSVYKTFSSSAKQIIPASLRVLHVVVDAIPQDAKIFRLGELRRKLIIRTDLLERLKREGYEGICTVPLGVKL